MPSLIEIQHNPYIPQMSVLIDGSRPSEFSRLIQFSDEDVWDWCYDILDAIYAETRRGFTVRFRGTEQDAAVVEFLSRSYENCRGFEARSFVVNESLQERMKKLNQHIKRNGITNFNKSFFTADFVFLQDTERYWEEIRELEVSNLFCAIKAERLPENHRQVEGDFAFVIARDYTSAEQWVQAACPQQLSFALILGTESKLIGVTDKLWAFETTEDDLFPTIFRCLLEKPLLQAFRRCAKDIGGSNSSRTLRKICSVEPLADIHVENSVEVGRSVRITVETDPPMAYTPELIFKVQNENIASCDGFSLFGKLSGETTLEVYKPGESKPFEVIPVNVYVRNRIKNLILSEDSLVLGVGDRFSLRCDYSPLDADNVAEIEWRSSDPKILRVDQRGHLTARAVGECRIICTAENVSAQCICRVRPYLESLDIDQELVDGVLILRPMEERTINVILFPGNAFDSDVSITSSDMDIVNIIQDRLIAKKLGEAVIILRNSSGRVQKEIKVVVEKEKKPGFFQTLFGNKKKE